MPWFIGATPPNIRSSGPRPVSTEPYVSEAFFDQERAAIFERCWLNVGRVDELPEPGSFLVKDIDVCRTSVLMVRGKDGVNPQFSQCLQAPWQHTRMAKSGTL